MKTEVVLGAVALILIGVIYFLKSTDGEDVGKAAAGVVTGFVGGIGGAVADAANNPDINPLHGVGSWIGRTIYDWTAPDGMTVIK